MKISRIQHLWAVTPYAAAAKDIIGLLKFQRAKAVATAIAAHLDKHIPVLPPGTIVSAVPTASSRVRTRGYDQARLIAKSFARMRGAYYQDTLRRISATRQVGANRYDRFLQLQGAFSVIKPAQLVECQILLIDDILTTGATLEQAALMLHDAHVKTINAAVFAKA